MIVMKFGGTSVRDSGAVERLIRIVTEKSQQKTVVVVSALAGITDTLIKIARHSAKGQVDDATGLSAGLEARHLKMAEELLADDKVLLQETKEIVEQYFIKLNEIVRVISILEELSDMSMAKILSYGEILSSSIIYKAMLHSGIKCSYADARSFIVTDARYLKGEPHIELI
jgi:bifunctional aspartokinase / homoserine dehydrogenase 1